MGPQGGFGRSGGRKGGLMNPQVRAGGVQRTKNCLVEWGAAQSTALWLGWTVRFSQS